MIAIIDYGMGNLFSVYKQFLVLDEKVVITSDPDVLVKADKLVLPGVGHFAEATKNLKSLGLWESIKFQVLIQKKPILGICLGMQLFYSGSQEGGGKGFDWIEGEVQKFHSGDIRLKVPHMGWNNVICTDDSALLQGIEAHDRFYFLHSYYVEVSMDSRSDKVFGTTKYINPFVSVIEKGNIYGVQFHPEKSHTAGLKLLKNFVYNV